MSNAMLEHYIRQIETIYAGDPWYGESLLDKVDHLSAEEAFASPREGVHSIAQIVAHMMVWRRVLIEHLQGNKHYKPVLDSAEDWNRQQTLRSGGWPQLLEELEQNQQKLLLLLGAQSDSWLEEPFRDGHNMRFLLEGIIQHDVYHIGQIGLLLALQKTK